MKPTVSTPQPEFLSMTTFAHHNRLLPRTRAPLSAVVYLQNAMNKASRISAQAPPGQPPSRIQ